MNRILAALAASSLALPGAAAAVVALSGVASADDAHRLTVTETVHLAGNLQSSTTAGSVSLAGAETDSGTGQFENGGATPTGPNILDAQQTWTGAHGTVTVALHGEFGSLPAQTAAGEGRMDHPRRHR